MAETITQPQHAPPTIVYAQNPNQQQQVQYAENPNQPQQTAEQHTTQFGYDENIHHEYSQHDRILSVNKDIYNTYAILRAKTIQTEHGPSTIWDSGLSHIDKAIFCFFLLLIFLIQVGGFCVLYYDADELAIQMRKAADSGAQVFLNDGFIEFTLPINESLLTNSHSNKLNISYASVNLLDKNPRVPVSDIDYSVLFAILVADICMVLTLFHNLSQMGGLMHLTFYLSEFHKQKKLVKTLLFIKFFILFLGSMASLNIIALATTSIEAIEKAVAVFFLLETSSWVYALIKEHPAIYDELYETVIDLSQVVADTKTQQTQQTQPNPDVTENDHIYQERVMMQEDIIQSEQAFVNVFLMTVTFSLLYIGIQFAWQLEYGTFGWSMIAISIVLVVIKIVLKNKAKHEAARRVELEMMQEHQQQQKMQQTQVVTQVVYH